MDRPDHAVLLDARAGERAVRAFIYLNWETAAAAAHRAAAASEPQNAMRPYSDDAGPLLLSGFGASAWRRNVALVASSPALFSELMPFETDCADVYAGLGLDLSRPAYGVDPTILRLLDAVP